MYRQGLGNIFWIFSPNALIQNTSNFKSTALFIFFLPHYASLLGDFTSKYRHTARFYDEMLG